MRPIWRKSPRSSRTAQCSRTISSSTRNTCIASNENVRPVGGMPKKLIGVSGLVGHLDAVGALRPGLSFERARDILWTLIGWEVYELLVIERGWSLDDWEAWVAKSTASLLLRDAKADV
jgi:hypothetical protein